MRLLFSVYKIVAVVVGYIKWPKLPQRNSDAEKIISTSNNLFHPVQFIQQCPISQINESHQTPCLEVHHTRNDRASPTQTMTTARKIARPAWPRMNARETTLCTDRRAPFPVLMSRWKTSYSMARQRMAWSIFAWSGKHILPLFYFSLSPAC